MRFFFYILIIGLFGGCIEPYTVEAPEGLSLLHVEGYITTAPGPHTIRLTRTATYGSVFVDFIRKVPLATVGIRDNTTGLVTFLTEIEAGVYQTPREFAAQVGRTYTLRIQTLEGDEYVSLPQETLAVPELDSLAYRMLVIPTENRLQPRSGLQFVAYFKDPSDQRNFYHWRVANPISRVLTYPEFYRPPRSLPTDPYQPKDCCKYCFVPDQAPIRNLYIADDSGFNGLSATQIAGFIEDNGRRFMHIFRFDFEQMAISQETHRYLRLIDQQLSLTGSVFDPPPANIRGNIVSLTNPEEVVLGHFFSAGVVSKRIYLKSEKLDLVQPQLYFPDDCRVLFNATIEEPDDWNP